MPQEPKKKQPAAEAPAPPPQAATPMAVEPEVSDGGANVDQRGDAPEADAAMTDVAQPNEREPTDDVVMPAADAEPEPKPAEAVAPQADPGGTQAARQSSDGGANVGAVGGVGWCVCVWCRCWCRRQWR